MKIFVDTAKLEDIKEAVSWGIIEGVTTNPFLIKQAVADLRNNGEKVDMNIYIKNILAAAGRMCPVFLELTDFTAEKMVEQGVMLYEKFNNVAGNVVIKIPVCIINGSGEGDLFDGIRAIEGLAEEKIPVNATLIFTPEQALIAAKAGAEFVTPFTGRVDDRIRKMAGIAFEKNDYFPAEGMFDKNTGDKYKDYGLVSGVQLIEKIVRIFNNGKTETEIIAASLRNPIQVREVAEAGAHIATMPFDVLKSMIYHPGTSEGIDTLLNDMVEEYRNLFTLPKQE